jgi:hypothetical protein
METLDYSIFKVLELREIAKGRGLKGYSKLLKSELIKFLKDNDAKKFFPPPSGVSKKKKSPVLSKEIPSSKIDKKSSVKDKFRLTSTLAFIYQISNPENKGYLPNGFKEPSFIFTYNDAIECSEDIHSPKWKIVEKYLDQFEKEAQISIHHKVDKKFLLDLFKKEALEFQKGNVTFLHSKNLKYLILDIISQLVSGSYEGFKPKCLRKNKDVNSKALDIVKKLFGSKELASIYAKDHDPSIRKRLISTNITLFNNAFVLGESTLEFLYSGSVLGPSTLLSSLGLDKSSENFVNKLMNDIEKIGNHLIVMYSIPMNKVDKYVYPSKPFGTIDSIQPDVYKNLEDYLSSKPWKSKFDYNYKKQTRLVDLCYTKYGFDDGVRIFQLTDIPVDDLEKFITKIDKKLSKQTILNEWIVKYIDISKDKRPSPLKSIRSYRSKKFLVSSKESTDDMDSFTRDKEEILSEIVPEVIIRRSRDTSPERDIVIMPSHEDPPLPLLIPSDIPDLEEGTILSPSEVLTEEEFLLAPSDIIVSPPKSSRIDYKSKTIVQLKAIAKDKGLKGYSKLRKNDLIDFLKEHD